MASTSGAPISILGQSEGSLVVFQKGDRPDPTVPASGKLYRVTMVGSTELEGASPSSTGVSVCVALRTWNGSTCAPAPPPSPGAVDCPSGWVSMNQRGAWQPGISLYAFARTAGPESAICGVNVALLDWTTGGTTWTVDQVYVQAMSDPLASWIQGYADDATSIAGNEAGRIAFGTDFNGLNGLLELSESGLPQDALMASACPVAGDTVLPDAGPLAMAPMRLRHSDGTLGDSVLIDERGLGTYGLLADMLAIIKDYGAATCGRAVHDSLMMSAEGTIRAWEAIENQTTAPAHLFPSAVQWRTWLESASADR